MTPTPGDRHPAPRADLVLDITLWLQIALLALILLQWHPPVRPFPPIFAPPKAPHTPEPPPAR